jgi:hypothetical protein
MAPVLLLRLLAETIRAAAVLIDELDPGFF